MHRIQTEEEAAMLRFNLGPLGHRLNVMLQIDQAASAVQTLIEENYTGKDSVAAREWAAYFEERIAAARSILVYEPSAGDGGTKKQKQKNKNSEDGEKGRFHPLLVRKWTSCAKPLKSLYTS